jgi:Amt family ammonium transporter
LNGLIVGWVYIAGSALLVRWKIDDAVLDAIPVNVFNGVWGTIAVGIFSTPANLRHAYDNDEHVGWLYELGRGEFDATLLVNQFVGLFLFAWSVVLRYHDALFLSNRLLGMVACRLL